MAAKKEEVEHLILRTMDNFKIGDELNVQLISNILDGSGNLPQISNYFK